MRDQCPYKVLVSFQNRLPRAHMLFQPCKDTVKRKPSMNYKAGTESAGALILDFASTVRNTFQLFINHPGCGIPLQQLEWTKTNSILPFRACFLGSAYVLLSGCCLDTLPRQQAVAVTGFSSFVACLFGDHCPSLPHVLGCENQYFMCFGHFCCCRFM